MIAGIIISILLIIIVLLSWGIRNLIKQVEVAEDMVLYYEEQFSDIREKALQTEVALKELDIKGAFESDDETGVIFQNIKTISDELTSAITETYEFRK